MNWSLLITAYLLSGPVALLAQYLLRRRKMALVRQYQESKGWSSDYDPWAIWPAPLKMTFKTGVWVCLLGPLALIVLIDDVMEETRNALQQVAHSPRFVATLDVLLKRHTIADVEANSVVKEPTISDCTVPSLPFGHMHFGWAHFKTQLLDGDEIWSFMAGDFQGYASLRQGLIVEEFIFAGD
jgi:hypothetical protein